MLQDTFFKIISYLFLHFQLFQHHHNIQLLLLLAILEKSH